MYALTCLCFIQPSFCTSTQASFIQGFIWGQPLNSEVCLSKTLSTIRTFVDHLVFDTTLL
jgi:hypothetical protein